MNSTIRYGILGTGKIASLMVNYIRESGNSDVIAVASSAKEKAIVFADKFGIKRSYGDYQALIADAQVDAVYIALPNSMHFEFSLKALEQGKHVLCEKPFVLQSAQLNILENIAKKNNLRIMECFWYRFHPLVDMVIDSVKRDIGSPLGFYSTFSFLNSSENNIRWNPALGGGALYDLMCYHIDAVNYIFKPDLAQWRCLEAFSRQRNGVEANINVEAFLSDKFQIILSASIDRQSTNRTTIIGTKGSLVIPNLRVSTASEEPFFYLQKDGEMRRIQAKSCNAYAGMIAAFSDALIQNTPVPVSVKESRDNLAMIERIRASLKTEIAERIALYPAVKRKIKSMWFAFQRQPDQW